MTERPQFTRAARLLPERIDLMVRLGNVLRRLAERRIGVSGHVGISAQVVGAREHYALALGFGEHWSVKLGAVERAEREREVGALGVVGRLEIGAEFDRCGVRRPADDDLPFATRRRRNVVLFELVDERLAGLLEGEAPVIGHVTLSRAALTAGDMVEKRVLIRVDADEIHGRPRDEKRESADGGHREAMAVRFEPPIDVGRS